MKNTKDLDKSLSNYDSNVSSKKTKMSKARMLGFGAAAAGGLFASAQADADINYTQFGGTVNTSTGLGLFNGFNLDIDGDSTNEMFVGLNVATDGASNPTFAAFRAYGFAGGVAAGGGNVPINFAQSSNINATSGTAVGNIWMGWNYASTTGASFNPFGVGTQPTEVIVGGQTSSGYAYWLRFELVNDGANTPASLTVVDYAYDDMNGSIAAGDVGIPEPGAVGLLALAGGAAAIRRRRKA